VKRLMVAATRSWRCMLVGGQARWWRSELPWFIVGVGEGEKSIPACLALARCRLRVAPFLPVGCHVNTMFTLRTEENPRFVLVLAANIVSMAFPFLKVLLGTGRSAWSTVGHRWRVQRLRVIIVLALRLCRYFFSFWACFCWCP
jgi:hypothetical protein